VNSARHGLERGVTDIHEWCAQRRLQLNHEKLNWSGSVDVRIQSVYERWTLQFILDRWTLSQLIAFETSTFYLTAGWTRVSTSPKWHQRASFIFDSFAGLAAHALYIDALKRIVCALILTRIDYCNSALSGLPDSTLAPLQRVLHAAARFVLDLRPRDHITAARQMHYWLLVCQRIMYKLCVLMHSVTFRYVPTYLQHAVIPLSTLPGRAHLRSVDPGQYDIPGVSSTSGSRAFSVAGPRTWKLELISYITTEHWLFGRF